MPPRPAVPHLAQPGARPSDQADQRLSHAIQRAVGRFARMIRSVGRGRNLRDVEMDELIQEVRIRLWRARGDAESIEALSTSYVYRTATAAAIDIIRRRRSGAVAVDEGAVRATDRPDPDEDLELAELRDAVRVALAAVAPSRRVVVQLHLAGYPKREIALLLGYTFPKVRNLLYRGLHDLRAALARQDRGASEP